MYINDNIRSFERSPLLNYAGRHPSNKKYKETPGISSKQLIATHPWINYQ